MTDKPQTTDYRSICPKCGTKFNPVDSTGLCRSCSYKEGMENEKKYKTTNACLEDTCRSLAKTIYDMRLGVDDKGIEEKLIEFAYKILTIAGVKLL